MSLFIEIANCKYCEKNVKKKEGKPKKEGKKEKRRKGSEEKKEVGWEEGGRD